MYKKMIQERLDKFGYFQKYDPRHVEAYIRLEHDTLDGLSSKQFDEEVRIGVMCIDQDGIENAEKCAQSFGL